MPIGSLQPSGKDVVKDHLGLITIPWSSIMKGNTTAECKGEDLSTTLGTVSLGPGLGQGGQNFTFLAVRNQSFLDPIVGKEFIGPIGMGI